MARPYPLPDRQQKRGCATVPVPREDVLVDGRVPKGCRFHPDKGNGTVLCTPKVAQKVGVLDVERKKPVPKPGEMSKRKYCYTTESPHPYRKDGELKQGCEVDEETGKVCCDRSYFRKKASGTKKAAKTARKAPAKKASAKKKSAKKAPAKKAPAKKASSKKAPAPTPAPKKKAPAKKSSKKKTSRKSGGQQSLFGVPGLALDLRAFDAMRPLADAAVMAPGGALALLDDGVGAPLVHEDPRALAIADDMILRPELPADITAPEAHLQSFGDMALTLTLGTALAAGGIAATYEIVDRLDYFDDKPVARAGVFVGAGLVPAGLAWWLSQDSEYGAEIRTLAAAWGISLSAFGVLGLIRTLMEKAAEDTEDPDEAKQWRDAASHVPWAEPHEHGDAEPAPDDEEPVDDEDEVSTDATDEPGTSGMPYPHSRFFR